MSALYRLFGLVSLCALLAGCAVPYYWQAVGGQLQMLAKRTPIDAIIDDPGQDPELRATLETALEIRRFAVEALGLPDNRSYTTYADLGRAYAVWNVIAAEEFAVDPKRWCFPVAGCVAYRGFFNRDVAERYQARLDRSGYDTYAAGAPAYSTLGFFADPVLNTMVVSAQWRLAGMIFHELAHQRLYFRDDSALSEAFASVIEEHGTERWLLRNDDVDGVARYRARLARRADFGALIAAQQSRLREIYARDDAPEQLRAAKADAFAALQAEYALLRDEWGGVADYDAWFGQPLNNATLAAVATYEGWLPALRWRLAEVGLSRFYEDMERLGELGAEDRYAWLSAWQEERASPEDQAASGLARLEEQR